MSYVNRLLVDGSTTDELFIKEPIIKQTKKKNNDMISSETKCLQSMEINQINSTEWNANEM